MSLEASLTADRTQRHAYDFLAFPRLKFMATEGRKRTDVTTCLLTLFILELSLWDPSLGEKQPKGSPASRLSWEGMLGCTQVIVFNREDSGSVLPSCFSLSKFIRLDTGFLAAGIIRSQQAPSWASTRRMAGLLRMSCLKSCRVTGSK